MMTMRRRRRRRRAAFSQGVRARAPLDIPKSAVERRGVYP
jgi:hypothetical protein